MTGDRLKWIRGSISLEIKTPMCFFYDRQRHENRISRFDDCPSIGTILLLLVLQVLERCWALKKLPEEGWREIRVVKKKRFAPRYFMFFI